jgi:hypothetical protein
MAIDPQTYLNKYKDIRQAYRSMAAKGTLGKGEGEYFKSYGEDLPEKAWVKDLNKYYGRNAKDFSEYDDKEFATTHFNLYGKKEGRHTNEYGKKEVPDKREVSTQEVPDAREVSTQEAPDTREVSTQEDKKANNEGFNLNAFQSLLGKLEDSKKRQQRQKSVEGRRDIYAQGLAGMMANF